MYKKLISAAFTLIFILLASVCAAQAKTNFNISDLNSCKKIYAYSGQSSAYFYGFGNTVLCSSRVIPDGITRYVSVDGTIRCVCHDENNAYALFESGNHQYSIAKMNMNDGSCYFQELITGGNVINSSFAVCGDEVFLILNDGVYSSVASYSLSGKPLHSYNVPQGVERLFTNGNQAYVKAISGKIFRISSGSMTYCADFELNLDFRDAGAGYVYTAKKQLVSLLNGNITSEHSDYITKTDSDTFRYEAGSIRLSEHKIAQSNVILLAAAGGNAAMLSDNYSCVVVGAEDFFSGEQNLSESEFQNTPSLRFSDNYIVDIEPGTTVAQIKKAFPQIISVYNANGQEVTSGKLRTGFSVSTPDGSYLLALRGDINSSGTRNSADVKSLMKYFTETQALSENQLKAADYNLDGSVDNRDLVLIARNRK